MRNNIVLTILIFSLLLWIPAAYIVHRIDRHEEDRVFKFEREMSRDRLVANVARMNPQMVHHHETRVAWKKGVGVEGCRVRTTGHHVG